MVSNPAGTEMHEKRLGSKGEEKKSNGKPLNESILPNRRTSSDK